MGLQPAARNHICKSCKYYNKGQCTYNVTLKRVRATIVTVEKK